MPTYQHAAFTVLDTYDILYGENKSDAGAGSERRRRFLDWRVFRFSRMLWNAIIR
jgi:hypothetical protein